MRTSRSVRALLTAFAALGGFVALSNAQSVATTPVGAVTKTIPVGLTAVGITLTNPDLAVANCSANTATVLTLSGVANVGGLLTSGLPYYIEAISGDLEGERFEVDTAATILSANGTVTLVASSSTNTLVLAAGNAVGSQFALRKHVTLAQVQSSFASPMVGNNTASSADQIWLLNAAGTAFNNYYLRADGVNWRLSGNPTNVPNTVIAPGVGIVIRKVGAAGSMVFTGGVRANDFAMPMGAGLSFRAPGYPVSYSPASLGGTTANGWTGNNTASSADQIQILNAGGTAFSNYYLRADGVNWRLSGSPTNVQNNTLIAYDSAYMLSRKSADGDYILVQPFTL